MCLEKGLDGKEERGRRGLGGEVGGGEACTAADWALLSRKVGVQRFGRMRFPQRGGVPGCATVCGITAMEMGWRS